LKFNSKEIKDAMVILSKWCVGGFIAVGLQPVGYALDSRENWIQYPPRNQTPSVEPVIQDDQKAKPPKILKEVVPGIKSNWEKNPPVDPATIVISKKIAYEGSTQTVTTTYENQSTKTESFQAITESFVWEPDHTTKNITFEFADGTSNKVALEVPGIVQASVYEDEVQIVKTTFADGYSKIVRRRPKAESFSWEPDHVTKKVTYYYSNGERNIVLKLVPPILDKPSYEGDTEKITAKYWDGEVKTKEIKSINTQITWDSDHVTKTLDYLFPDGTHNFVMLNVDGVAGEPNYEGSVKKITTTFADGYQETKEYKAQKEVVTWSSDHLMKLTTYLFKDGTTNKVTVRVEPVISEPDFQDNKKTIVTTFGDGSKSSQTFKALSQDEILSPTKSSKKVKYAYEDGSKHTESFVLNETDEWVIKRATVTTKDKSEPVVKIKRFIFSGNKIFTDQVLNEELLGWVGQDADFTSIKNATVVISDFYKDAGWLTRAELPPQDVTEGIVKIKITEASFSGVKVIAKADVSLNEKLPIKTIELKQKVGDPVNLESLEKSSILVSEIPGTQANISLNPGQEEGTTEIAMSLEKAKLLNLTATVDNFGALSTGENRLSTQSSLNGPLQRGDLWSVQTLQSAGLQYLRGSYSENVGYSGLRLGLYASNMQYQLITPEYMGLNPFGPSNDRGIEMSDPLIRTKNLSLTWQATVDQKHFENTTVSGTTSNYSAKIITSTLQGNRTDELLKGGTNSGALQLTLGEINLNGSPNQLSDLTTTNTQGNYVKAKLALSRLQKITNTTTLVGTYQSQWASKNLDGSEMFYLGGMQGIRAFPTNEGGGSLGQMLNVEVQNLILTSKGSLVVTPFFDTGEITVNKFNTYANSVAENNYGLSGAGFWVGLTDQDYLGQFSLKFTLSRRIGPNPGQTPVGMDQNGTYTLNRYWLSASQSF